MLSKSNIVLFQCLLTLLFENVHFKVLDVLSIKGKVYFTEFCGGNFGQISCGFVTHTPAFHHTLEYEGDVDQHRGTAHLSIIMSFSFFLFFMLLSLPLRSSENLTSFKLCRLNIDITLFTLCLLYFVQGDLSQLCEGELAREKGKFL